MNSKSLFILTTISTALVTVMFLGGEPSSMRGLYYVIWLAFGYFFLWKHQDTIAGRLQSITFSPSLLFLFLGLAMIILEETIAGTMVHILHIENLGALWNKIILYYANNLLLLSGYIIGWYFLLKRCRYTLGEIITLVGIFGLYAEKIYMHVLTIPILGIPLILPTVFTYFFILFPSILSLRNPGNQEISRMRRYTLGLIIPLIASIPLILIHTYLSKLGYIDPSILTR